MSCAAKLRAGLERRALAVRRGLAALGALSWAAATVDGLKPRPDWYGAPIHIFPLRARWTIFGGGLVDKLEHFAFGLGLMLVLGGALDGPGWARNSRRLALAIGGWMLGIET